MREKVELSPLIEFEPHDIPSDEVRTVPSVPPTIRNLLFAYVTPVRVLFVPVDLKVQEEPLDEVRMYPLLPTPTNKPLEVVDSEDII